MNRTASPDRYQRRGLGQWERPRWSRRIARKERDPMPKLTDTQLVILTAAAQRKQSQKAITLFGATRLLALPHTGWVTFKR